MATQKKTLGDIFEQILADDKNKFDTVVSAGEIRMKEDGKLTRGIGTIELTDWATTQMAQKLGIPVKYIKNCPPELRAQNFNHWLENSEQQFLIRGRSLGEGHGNIARAVLSADHYSKLDNAHIVEMLQKILGNGEKAGYDTAMWHLDDGGFHLRLTFDDLTTNIGQLADGRPDVHKVGLHVANSEVGKRSIMITPMVYRLVCTNGLMRWVGEGSFTQRHVHLQEHEIYGRVAQAVGEALKAGDAIINELRAAKTIDVENPLDILRELAHDRQYSQAVSDQLQLSYAANAAQTGNNVFSLVQAITETAQRASHPDYRIEMEKDAADLMKELVVA